MNKKKDVVLSVEERKAFGTGVSRKMRREGKIPAIVYGRGHKSKSLLLNENEWKKLAQHGDVHLVELRNQEGGAINALVKDVQHDYLKGATLHVDFLEVKMDEMITTSIAVYGRGTAIGISQGGVLEQLLHEIEVRCLPGDIPESIEIDISGIELDKALYVKDIIFPSGVSAAHPPEQVVFHVIRLRIEEEAPAAAAEGEVAAVEGAEAAPQEPELVGAKGKKIEEGEVAEEKESREKEKEKKK